MITTIEESAFLGNGTINTLQCNSNHLMVSEIYLDGQLIKAECVDEHEKSYGIFIHSLILSSSKNRELLSSKSSQRELSFCKKITVAGLKSNQLNNSEDEFEKAINWYTVSKGFNNALIESVAPKVTDLTLQSEGELKASAYMINGKYRLITKGAPDLLLKRCTFILSESKVIRITRRLLREVNEIIKIMVNRSLNVYAIALKDIAKLPSGNRIGDDIDDLTLVALVGIGNI
jgi:magnesium-transporting ATPase (P-type)